MVVQLSNQRQIIVKGFGFDEKGTILFGCIDGLIEGTCCLSSVHHAIVSSSPLILFRITRTPRTDLSSFPSLAIAVVCTVTAATYWRSGRAYSAVLAYAVAILGSILVNVLPNEKFSLLFSYWMSSTYTSTSQDHLPSSCRSHIHCLSLRLKPPLKPDRCLTLC